ncbi:MAG: EamA/RhaT family transporter [Desulfuromonas sp.]|nr:MAG: EamA/RhaT family transporter [Desulfuromonas sp.]
MKLRQPKRGLAEFLLVTVTIFWGGTFPLVKEAIVDLPVMAFLWVRFALAAILLALLAGPKLLTLDRRGVKRGVLLGCLLFLSYLFQTWGLDRTSSANTGFLTGLNVVWVPLLAGPLLQKPPAFGARIGVGLAFAGLLLLTWQSPWHLNPGDALVFICSIFIALHILGLDAWTAGYNGLALTCVQITTMALLAFVGSFFFEPFFWPRVWDQQLVVALLVCSVFATVYAFWVMTTFQRLTTPTRAALIYTLEPVFAAAASVWLLAERLTAVAWCGGVLIVLGMIVAESWPLISRKLGQAD